MSFDLERFAARLKTDPESLDEQALTAALPELEALDSGAAYDWEARARLRSLLGRVLQELYLRSEPGSERARDLLERSVLTFLAVYRSAPERHSREGMAAAALLARGRQDGIVLPGFPQTEMLATEILDSVERRETAGRLEAPGDFAAAAEACIALGGVLEALDWLRRYAHQETDSAEGAATLRQLTGVWRLEDARLLSTLQDRFEPLRRSRGFDLSVPVTRDKGLEGLHHLPPEKPLAVHDNVTFTVYKPRVVAPLEWYPLLAFAHLEDLPDEARRPGEPSLREQVEAQAAAALGTRLQDYADDSEDASQAVPHEAEITFVPFLPGFRFNPPQATFLFLEPIQKEEFRMQAPPDLDGQTVRGRLSVYWGHILLAEMNLRIRVDSRARTLSPADAGTEREAIRPYRDVFASYSHQDTPIVLEFERYLRALGDRYLIDRDTLRAGQVWDDRLQGMIREADVFQLFWSRNAMQSDFVEKEWRYALALGRGSFVRPVYWEDPLPSLPEKGLPPEELRRLHFHFFPRRSEAEKLKMQADLDHSEDPLPYTRPRKKIWAASLMILLAVVSYTLIRSWGDQAAAVRAIEKQGITIVQGQKSDPELAVQQAPFVALVPVEEVPAGTEVTVVWVSPDGPQIQETQTVYKGNESLR
ncbi:MAG TPA: toll/interleukin-1 receptor domain-containing protein, partial [Thermoanaerobaculia bacterium]|nr:toll/interleukin-1 receptor domain-containing protein [Thermoanaerobaculia bacterium]